MSFVGKWFGFGRNPHYDDGVRAYERQDYEAAIELFKVCVSSDPELATRDRAKSYLAGALGKQARLFIAQRDFATAQQYLTEAVSVRPRFADLRRWLAYAYCLDGRPNEAREELTHALEINPRYGQALALRSALLVEAGETSEGIKTARLAAREDSRLLQATIGLAEKEIEKNDLKAAYVLLRDWPIDPHDSFEADLADADRAMKKRRYEQAEQLYRELIDRRPRYADIRVKHGQALLEASDLTGAINEFREAIALNDRFSEAYALLGIGLRRQGQEQEAKDSFRQALAIDGNNDIAASELMRLRA